VLSSTVTAGGTIGAINLSWTAVSGASFYTVYETESPTGVAGATALTTTSSTRTPGTARNYEYWVTATVGGVESATSNRIQATLPYVAPGGGGGTPSSNPSTFLNINGLGTGTGGWWNLGVGLSSGHIDIDPTALKTYVNSPYYTMNATSTGVQFEVFMNGGKTSANTKYPRCELREYATGSTSTKAAWSGSSGRHIMRGKSKVMHYAPIKCEVVVAQMHDASDDTLQIRAEATSATGPQTWRLSINGTEVDDLISGVALGQEVAWDIDVNNGSLTVKINGATAYGPSNPGWGAGQYFKVGAYPQQNSTDQANSSTEYSRVELRDLFVSHA
jgi:poly(beta-D-mannuronate) lyase